MKDEIASGRHLILENSFGGLARLLVGSLPLGEIEHTPPFSDVAIRQAPTPRLVATLG